MPVQGRSAGADMPCGGRLRRFRGHRERSGQLPQLRADLDGGRARASRTWSPFPAGWRPLARMRVGTGTASWGQFTLTCDVENPCALVVEMQVARSDYRFASVPLTFAAEESPVAGCEVFPDAAPETAGADRMLDVWAKVTKAHCDEFINLGVMTQAPLAGEGAAMQELGTGRDRHRLLGRGTGSAWVRSARPIRRGGAHRAERDGRRTGRWHHAQIGSLVPTGMALPVHGRAAHQRGARHPGGAGRGRVQRQASGADPRSEP